MFAVVALLCLASLSRAAPLACEDLVRPLDHLTSHHVEGRWALVAGSLSNPAHMERFKTRDSASIMFTDQISKIFLTRIFGFNGTCQYLHSNITLEGSGFTFYEFNLTVTLLKTSCPDCLVMRFDNSETKQLLRLYLLNGRMKVDEKEMEEFKAQVECLNLLPPVMMDPTKQLCPEQISTEPTAQTEEETEGQEA